MSDVRTVLKQENENLKKLNAELLEALTAIIETGKRDLSNEKYDGYFVTARNVIAKAQKAELVSALLAMIEDYDAEKEVMPAYYQARAAIAKAKGE